MIQIPTQEFLDSVRQYQTEYLASTNNHSVLMWHRGSRKTTTILQKLLIEAHKKIGLYWYIGPYLVQARSTIWTDPSTYIFRWLPEEYRKVIRINNSEMSLTLPNGSVIQAKGADHPDSLRGPKPVGVVVDEYGEIAHRWGSEFREAVIEPSIASSGGWVDYSGCVTKDTFILGENGFENIINEDDTRKYYKKIDRSFFGLNGFHKATHFYSNGKSKTIKITTWSGFEIEGTPNHKLWTNNGWKRLDEFQIGDDVLIQRGQNVFGTERLDDKYAYFLGLYMAEGSQEYGRNKRVTITSGDREIGEFLIKEFNFKKRDKFHYRLNSKDFSNWLIQFFPPHIKAPQKEIPRQFYKWDKRTQSNFLRGYFDGDGHSDTKGMIGCVSSSKKIIDALHIILLNFGIVAYKSFVITKPTKRVRVSSNGWRLEIGGYNAKLFFKEIGFSLKRKQEREKLVERFSWYNDCTPFSVYDFKGNNKLSAKYGNLCQLKNISYSKLKRLINDHPISEKYKQILDNNFYNDKIKSIEYGENYTYDFVIPETHSFFSNGFISHNTPKGNNDFAYLLRRRDYFTSLKTVDDTGIFTPEQIEDFRRNAVNLDFFNQEYYCKIVEGASSVFKNIENAISGQLEKPIAGEDYLFGIDLARSFDATVLVGFRLSTNHLVYYEKIQNRTWEAQKNLIAGTLRAYNDARAIVDATGVGDSFTEQLMLMGLNITPMKIANNLIKRNLIEKLGSYLENRYITIPNIPEVIDELKDYEYTLTANNNIVYNAPSGKHDDIVMALALAVSALSPTPIVYPKPTFEPVRVDERTGYIQ